MDFAKKQLEKFGWKEGNGLGKDEQGIIAAIKPTLKVGKEGMGYDFSKELVDTWWTRAYDDSLKRLNVDVDKNSEDAIGVTLGEDEDGEEGGLFKDPSSERPFMKMKKRMMKASFPTFSKGATLSNGEMISTEKSDSDDSESDTDEKPKDSQKLTDEELFKACGGRTAHKAARFGLKLNGKLARIEAAEKAFLSKYSTLDTSESDKKKETSSVGDDSKEVSRKKKKSQRKQEVKSDDCSSSSPSSTDGTLEQTSAHLETTENGTGAVELKSKKKKKKSKKRKYEELEESIVENEASATVQEDNCLKEKDIPTSEDYDDRNSITRKEKKKRKKNKKSKYNDNDDDSCELLS